MKPTHIIYHFLNTKIFCQTTMSTFSVKDLEVYIQKLIRKFKDEPDFFYSDSDMHCYLYRLLYENPTLQRTYFTKDGKQTGILEK